MLDLQIKYKKMKSMSPLVSVIVPAYNMEQYIAETLDSILRSTYENIEVIVIDDGSTDATISIVEEFIKLLGLAHQTRAAEIILVARALGGLKSARAAKIGNSALG